ncbi:phage integrase central domain-containing protein [Methylocystis parvus]|uniref:phage integrase central domain-containing protein n=1 Tax=Methylocystis parvus TaxID=134 RepID=UPI003C729D04
MGSVYSWTKSAGRSWWFLREKTAEARELVRSGVNPIEARRAGPAEAPKPTFGRVASELIDSKKAGWRNAKHRDQWRSSLITYAAALTDRPVDQIDGASVGGYVGLVAP